MPRLYADLHCHPTLYSFNRLRNSPVEHDPALYHPWSVLPERMDQMNKARRASHYAQADMAKLTASRCRLTFASITPIERDFLVPSAEISSPLSRELLKLGSGATLLQAALTSLRGDRPGALRELTGVLRNDGPLRAAIQRMILGYEPERMRFMTGPDFDYWQEFLHEYDFYVTRDGERVTTESPAAGHVQGAYHLIHSLDQVCTLIEDEQQDELAILLTIEGAHTFTIAPDGTRHPTDVIHERITALKSLPAPIFFITLAHHFDNGICGHAHSLPDAVMALADQRVRMHEGFEPEDDLGRSVARRLLSLDDDLRDTGERRILLDCKHMSARTRQQYYSEIITPANALRAEQGLTPLPVIFSHGAYSGVHSLDALIADGPREEDSWRIGPYYAWNLHCCDEDIVMILKTRGLFGICFDQRVAGLPSTLRVHPDRLRYVLLQQLFGVVDVVMTDDRLDDETKRGIWDCICIGSDFDGMIDPVSAYPTALSFDAFARDLERGLREVRHTRMIDAVGVEAIVEKISWQNAWRLVTTQLPDATR